MKARVENVCRGVRMLLACVNISDDCVDLYELLYVLIEGLSMLRHT